MASPQDATQLTFFAQFPESPRSPYSAVSPGALPLATSVIESTEVTPCSKVWIENLTKDDVSHDIVDDEVPPPVEVTGSTDNGNERQPGRPLPRSLLRRALTKAALPTSFFPKRTPSAPNSRPSLRIETVMSRAQGAANASTAQSAPVKGNTRRGNSVLGRTPESTVKVQRDHAAAILCSPNTVPTGGFSNVRNRSSTAARPGLESQLERWRSVQRIKVSI